MIVCVHHLAFADVLALDTLHRIAEVPSHRRLAFADALSAVHLPSELDAHPTLAVCCHLFAFAFALCLAFVSDQPSFLLP